MKTLNTKQSLTIALILALGVLLGILILWTDTASADDHRQEQTQENGHEDHDHDEDEDGDEDNVTMSAAQIRAADIRVLTAGAAQIRTSIALPGEIRLNGDRTAHIVPRVAGVAQRVPVNLGQRVKKGEVMAVLASMEVSDLRSTWLAAQQQRELARLTLAREKSLWEAKISAEQDYLQAQQAWQEADLAAQNARLKLAALGMKTDGKTSADAALNLFEVRAPFDGVVIEKHITLGEALKEDTAIFTLSDLSTVWAEMAVPASELDRVRVGEKVTVHADALKSSADGTVAHVGALLGAQTRTATARVLLDNPQGSWRPGLFVSVEVVTDETQAPVVVQRAALHRLENRDVVFMKTPDGFVAQPVKAGRRHGERVEILDGLHAGDQYAADNSFIIRSELGKDSAGHGHEH